MAAKFLGRYFAELKDFYNNFVCGASGVQAKVRSDGCTLWGSGTELSPLAIYRDNVGLMHNRATLGVDLGAGITHTIQDASVPGFVPANYIYHSGFASYTNQTCTPQLMTMHIRYAGGYFHHDNSNFATLTFRDFVELSFDSGVTWQVIDIRQMNPNIRWANYVANGFAPPQIWDSLDFGAGYYSHQAIVAPTSTMRIDLRIRMQLFGTAFNSVPANIPPVGTFKYTLRNNTYVDIIRGMSA